VEFGSDREPRRGKLSALEGTVIECELLVEGDGVE